MHLSITGKASRRANPATPIKSLLTKIIYAGISDHTPSHLVDRIVYSNWICLLGTLLNIIDARANVVEHFPFLLCWNGIYQLAILACWLLNRRKAYLAGRLVLLSIFYLGVIITSAAQGPAVQVEHFLLALSALAFTLFHPSERRWAWIFGALSAFGFLFFVNQNEPLFHLHFANGLYAPQDLRLNQYCYTLLYVLSLIALSNAYARATKVADEQRAKLFESSKMASLGQMAGGIAHEINNPLSIILAIAEKMSRQAKNGQLTHDDVIQSSERLQNTAFRIVHIVRGLQHFSRDGEKLPFAQSSLNQIIDDTVALCQERFKSMGIELSIERTPRDTAIECRAVQVSQALLNLLNNACDATRSQKEKWVHVSTHDLESKVKIYVRNGGEKIPPFVQEKLFQPFFTTKEVGGGTGLGLSVSLAMMREHGGSIHFDALDPNTTFVMTLPKSRDLR